MCPRCLHVVSSYTRCAYADVCTRCAYADVWQPNYRWCNTQPASLGLTLGRHWDFGSAKRNQFQISKMQKKKWKFEISTFNEKMWYERFEKKQECKKLQKIEKSKIREDVISKIPELTTTCLGAQLRVYSPTSGSCIVMQPGWQMSVSPYVALFLPTYPT
jgi:hypothetical protein